MSISAIARTWTNFEPLKICSSFVHIPTQFFNYPTLTYFWKKSPLQPLLTLSPQQLNESWPQHQNLVIETMYLNGPSRHHLQTLFARLNYSNLIQLMETLCQKVIEKPETLKLYLQSYDRQQLEMLVNCQAKTLAKKEMPFYPPDNPLQPKTHENSKTNVLFHFIPNLIDTLLKALNVQQIGKPAESIWDYWALISIYAAVLSIPPFILTHVKHFVQTNFYAYLITATLVAAIPIGLYIYLKWLRPLANQIPYCDKPITTKIFADRTSDIDELISKIEGGFDILIYGETGVGKTGIVFELAKRLKNKTIYQLQNEAFEKDFSLPKRKMDLAFHEANNYPGKVIFFIDEFGKEVKNEELIKTIQTQSIKKQFQFIATCTTKEYNETIAPNKELSARFTHQHELKPPTKEGLQTILLEYYRTTPDIDCKDPEELINYIIDKTKNSGAQPREALHILELAIQKIKQFDIDNWEPQIVKEKKQQLRTKQDFYRSNPKDKMKNEMLTLKNDIDQQTPFTVEQRKQMKHFNQLLKLRKELRDQYENDIKNIENNINAKRALFYTYFLKEKLEKTIDQLEPQLPAKLRLDKNFLI